MPQYITQMVDYIGQDFSYNLSIVIMPSAFPYKSAGYQKLVFLSKDVLTSDLQNVYPLIGEAIATNWFGQTMYVKEYNQTWVNSAMITFVARKTTYLLSQNLGFYQFEAILGNETLYFDYNNLDNNT